MNKKYRIEVYPMETADGEIWVAHYPDLEGCLGQGVTVEEAIREAEENKKEWLNMREELDLDIPEPTNVDDYLDYSGKFPLRMPKSTHATASKLAKKDGCSLNTFIVNAISYYTGTKCAQQINYNFTIDKINIGQDVIKEAWAQQTIEKKNHKIFATLPGGVH